MRIGVLSDTHDLLRPEALRALAGCACILHAGDISSRRVLDELEKIAPVKAVRGNNDKEWGGYLPLSLDLELGGLRIYMAHRKKDLPKDIGPYDTVIYGHTHRYACAWAGSAGHKRTLLLNPGSCGPARFHQDITMAALEIDGEAWTAEKIVIPRAAQDTCPETGRDIRRQIEAVIRETRKGRSPAYIAGKYGMEPALAEQIARLYLTHPGVTADGIMAKMGPLP